MWTLIGIVVTVLIVSFIRNRNEDDANDESSIISTAESNQEATTSMEEKISTRQLALNVIEKIGCEPQYTEEGRIQFKYQGVIFLMEANDECLFVNLIWPWCYSFSKFNIEEFARMRQVINDINLQGSVTVFYSIADSDDVAVHMKKNFLLVSQIPSIDEYLGLILDTFFRTARTLDSEIEKCKIQVGDTNEIRW